MLLVSKKNIKNKMIDFPSSRESSPDQPPPQQKQSKAAVAAATVVASSSTANIPDQNKTTTTTTPQLNLKFPVYDFTLASARRPRSFEGFDLLQKVVATEQTITSHPLYFYHDELCAVIYDAYPKASVHLLLLPRDTTIKTVADLDFSKPSHKFLLEHMKIVSDGIIKSILESNDGEVQKTSIKKFHVPNSDSCFRVGFHSKPSLLHCHLHIVSADFFASPNLKHKTHYLSFATDFFFELNQVIKSLTTSSNQKVTREELNSRIECANENQGAAGGGGGMGCFYCKSFVAHTFAALKKHVLEGNCRAIKY